MLHRHPLPATERNVVPAGAANRTSSPLIRLPPGVVLASTTSKIPRPPALPGDTRWPLSERDGGVSRVPSKLVVLAAPWVAAVRTRSRGVGPSAPAEAGSPARRLTHRAEQAARTVGRRNLTASPPLRRAPHPWAGKSRAVTLGTTLPHQSSREGRSQPERLLVRGATFAP